MPKLQQSQQRGVDGHPGHHHQAIHTVTDDSDDDLASRLECLEFSSIEKNSGDNRDELYASAFNTAVREKNGG